MPSQCPICKQHAKIRSLPDGGDGQIIICDNCGEYPISRTALSTLDDKLNGTKNGIAILSHAIFKMKASGIPQPISPKLIDTILKNSKLPTPLIQADNLIWWLGKFEYGQEIQFIPERMTAKIGALNEANARLILFHLIEENFLYTKEFSRKNSYWGYITLTLKGWERFEELKRGHTDSRLAFMAMDFNHDNIKNVYENHFIPAVEQTGFTLETVAVNQKAGLIDDAIRVKILNSKFIIADLSHSNNGAYWEAGYAEGLDKPVIYTCEESVFDNPKTKPHFDTNHHLTIKWNLDKIDEAKEQLKNTIRATLPGDAKMQDD